MPAKSSAKMNAALDSLRQIGKLRPNWNENNAPAFDAGMIRKARELIVQLPYAPSVSPTARPSIWMEYHDAHHGRLAFELLEDGSIISYRRDAEWNTKESAVAPEDMAGAVRDFCE